jgi:hypothetical protein
MNPPVKRDNLVGRWLHVYEEDSEDLMVFRSDQADLPPSRGRNGIVLNADGTMQRLSPGFDDRMVEVSSNWKLDSKGQLKADAGIPGADGKMFVESATPDRLVFRVKKSD